MSATRNVPSMGVCRPRKSPATFGSAPPSGRHTRYGARPRVKVTGVLSPERGPRDTKGARGGIPDEAAGYSGIPQLSANSRDRNRRIRWGIERVLRRNGLNQVNPVHLRDRVAGHHGYSVKGQKCEHVWLPNPVGESNPCFTRIHEIGSFQVDPVRFVGRVVLSISSPRNH